MPYYLFRDKDHKGNDSAIPLTGAKFNAAGIVVKNYGRNDTGKELAVMFFHPFDLAMCREWREFDDVELMEVHEDTYMMTLREFEAMENA